MAFSPALHGGMEDLRFPNMRPTENDTRFSAALPRQRDSNPFYPGMDSSAPDVRRSLQRRFSTYCGHVCLGTDTASKDEAHGCSCLQSPQGNERHYVDAGLRYCAKDMQVKIGTAEFRLCG